MCYILTLPGAIRDPGKRADEEVYTSRMARWKHGALWLRHSYARPGEELFWSSRHPILLGCFWYVVLAPSAVASRLAWEFKVLTQLSQRLACSPDASISLACGTREQKLRRDFRSSSLPQLLPEASVG